MPGIIPTTTILALETSCDETGVAVLRKEGDSITVLAQALASQVDVHALTGGVVPEVAAREHTQVIGPLIKNVLYESRITSHESPVDAIAVTIGPGLIPALVVGVQAARTLAFTWQKPIVPVHHIAGHIASALLSAEETRSSKLEIRNKFKRQKLSPITYHLQPNLFPALALIVSGGHTMLILMRDHLQYEVIGQTRDDAAGEAFDKVARLLELPYPGGPHLSKLAETGDKEVFDFPRPMINSADFDFSFSGLKTAVLYTLRKLEANPPSLKLRRASIAASFEQAVVDVLVTKTKKAAQKLQPKTLLLAGGVAANKPLREQLQAMADKLEIPLKIAPLNLCGDNAVMIGQIGVLAYEKGRTTTWDKVDATARIPIESFSIT
jgi:N6-L-threonylcarbamoyladenine synthase